MKFLPRRATERPLTRRAVLQSGAALIAAPALPGFAATSPAWPNKPVRIIIPSAGGGPWDPMARHLAEQLGKSLGQPFIVENKSGATGMIGMDQVAKSTDGHTLGVMFMPHTLLPALFPKIPYDTLKDLVPIAQTQWTYNVLVTRPGLGVSTITELVALARSKPGKLTYASGGNGSPAHVIGEYFKKLTGTQILHIPYRGPVAALTDLIGGQSDMSFVSAAVAIPYVQSGKLLALGVSSPEPLANLPDVPTFAKVGYPQFDVRDWAGIVAPRSLPEGAAAKVNAAILKAFSDQDVRERFAKLGTYLHTGTQAEFAELIRTEIPKWAEVVRDANIRMD